MYDFTSATESGPATVRVGLPPASLLSFPPSENHAILPAPQATEWTWQQPFNIPDSLYTQMLDIRVPITIAGTYAVTVVLINRINKSRGYKPYAFSNTRLFKLFVILHNVFLAIYSMWTFAGMFQAFRNSMPGWNNQNGLVGITDSLCKANGPRGYGNAATYNSVTDQWSIANPEMKLGEGGLPDPSDVGRLWNQGLGFLGWIFYLSKFYEVLDTAIILAKGKKSSTLQTYHHAGAMMCMWAGIRYMAPPIWIFTLVNSGIHALMYTYYTLTALRIRVPQAIKQSLTTMQITQFVFGTAMAASYLFVSYTLPYAPASREAASVPATAGSSGPAPWLKKFAFRAAGAEGVAENVGAGQKPLGAIQANDSNMVTCLDTTGQAFAVWLNVMYLLPLTFLFVRFFIRSYLYRKAPSTQHPTQLHPAEKAGLDALKGVSREIQKAALEQNGELTDDEAVAKAQAQAKKPQQSNVNSPIKTRSSTQKKSAANGNQSEQGFSPVKKGSKKSSAPDIKGNNPYDVLSDKA
ncbi:hypothetical protein ASPWEDRAFT_68221 [Aspergillus wentii DTO 134E9]|uniref:Elongation of fatty acids protein n=1 Tax=Aspergillus wentii DTO 134E9 TaxID=1073089 RepID=A0A1L9RIP6_ASPWE|nr:uncharacterized protein ASPWEDRAFT_68221 [Aspergillus wentii DTO 134E9]KAI9932267.1 hypothetical protein MW887_009778 [Aspergillus wentii]OJJ34771.1 hypothetical protein ASPWEDRAFT_68221 [Aspergillus wentii DTO 134E9]